MPELPEVERVRRTLAPAMTGARFDRIVLNRADLRQPFPEGFARRLRRQTVRALTRRGKYLLAELSSGDTLVMHLGMSGWFRVEREGDAVREPADAHDHVVFHMSSGAQVIFNDPRRFGLMLLVPRAELAEHPLMREVGPEPLGNAFDSTMLARACAGKKTSLKAALSDQKVVAGLGNIYVCEALHRARLSPKRRASTLVKRGVPTDHAERLVDAIKTVLNDAIAAGGSSLRDHRRTDGELGEFQHNFRVYDREAQRCVTPGCPGTVKRIVQGGRSTFFCPTCQK